MITSISIKNFKCFKEQSSFNFSKINLLTGLNGRGKSSLLQVLLLLSQSHRKNKSLKDLALNGEWVKLGIYDDVKSRDSNEETNIEIKITTNDSQFNDFHFTYSESKNERVATLTGLFVDKTNKFVEMGSNNGDDISGSESNIKPTTLTTIENNTFAQFNKFHFISADRLGPVEFVHKTDSGEILNVGVKGENFINVLTYNHDYIVDVKICKETGDFKLKTQVENWLSYILDGASISFNNNKQSSIIEILLNSCNNNAGYKPINVGFGYSYILPIIVACLISKPGDIIIIENPEAHLHPRAQSRFTELFTLLATYGVQLFIESHSEHILNGLRVNSLRESNTLKTEDISIYFWDNDNKYEQLIVEKNGKIQNWPSKFFDQQESDLAEIFRLGRLQK